MVETCMHYPIKRACPREVKQTGATCTERSMPFRNELTWLLLGISKDRDTFKV